MADNRLASTADWTAVLAPAFGCVTLVTSFLIIDDSLSKRLLLAAGYAAVVSMISSSIVALVVATRPRPDRLQVGDLSIDGWLEFLRGRVTASRTQSQLAQVFEVGDELPVAARNIEIGERSAVKGAPASVRSVMELWAGAPTRLLVTAEAGYGKTVSALIGVSSMNEGNRAFVAELFPLVEWAGGDTDLFHWMSMRLRSTYHDLPEAMADTLVSALTNYSERAMRRHGLSTFSWSQVYLLDPRRPRCFNRWRARQTTSPQD